MTKCRRLVLDLCVDNFFAETEQVGFCAKNFVPGVDFTNAPLLQGRNFSYLDTQLKRLGSPNFAKRRKGLRQSGRRGVAVGSEIPEQGGADESGAMTINVRLKLSLTAVSL